MVEKQVKWTKQQLRAIKARGRDILVSASAGTGKTAVLSGRCVDIISDRTEKVGSADILVLTFTDAAAEQMRSRIREQMRRAYLQQHDPYVWQQLILLQGADISTIHSFCKRLITEYFYLLNLDPTFRVIDEDEQRLLKTEILEKTINWAWQQSDLIEPLAELLYGRDLRTTEGFLANIIHISDFLDGLAWRQGWYERALEIAQFTDRLGGRAAEKQKQIVVQKLDSILDRFRQCQGLYHKYRADDSWPDAALQGFIETVKSCIELLKVERWDECAQLLNRINKPTVRRPRQLPEAIGEMIKKTMKNAVDSFIQLRNLAIINPDYLEKIGQADGRQVKVLLELIKKFDQLYDRAKKQLNCLDFADLQRYALKLLCDEKTPPDEPAPSQTALALRERYRYIFVDEYQDINLVQKRIIDLLKRGDNVFVVGDIKQSIYAWRGAMPTIFLKDLESASGEQNASNQPLRVDLNTNFRSKKGILDFVNKVFSRIMTASFASIDYDDSARLTPAVTEQTESNDGPVVELHILDKPKEHKDDDSHDDPLANEAQSSIASALQCQAMLIARRIKQIVGAETGKPEFQIYDKRENKYRDVEYRDIVILMRSLAGRSDFVEVLRLASVPVSCEAITGYFEAGEISDMLCLLKVLENPQRDIELAAVLRSPCFKVSDTELAKIKLHGGDEAASFYERVLQYSRSGTDKNLATKLEAALTRIEQWRTMARRGNLAELIWKIYRQTGLLSFVCALPNGRTRRANLLKLHDLAIQFESFASSAGIPSLRRFVQFIEKLEKIGQDWAPAEPDSSAENSVRVITVHKSKGLEFPVVFLAGLDSKFNKDDIRADYLLDVDHALGLRVIDKESNSKLPSLAYQVIAEQKQQIDLAEEMRILYVATTRAREKLIITASENKKRCQTILCEGLLLGGKEFAPWQLQNCRSPLEWLLYGLSDQKNLHSAFETTLSVDAPDEQLCEVTFYDTGRLRQLSDEVERLRKSPRTTDKPKEAKKKTDKTNLLPRIKESLGWRYPFRYAVSLPAKRSVTQITHSTDEFVVFDYSRALQRQPRALAGKDSPEAVLDARLVGTAVHLLLAELDLSKPVTRESIEQTRQKLLDNGLISTDAAEHIRTESILGFFESDLGRVVLDKQNKLWREWPFTFALPAGQWQQIEALEPVKSVDETIIVQGTIDMLVQSPAALVVIDFKTDRIPPEQVSRRAETYRRQLELYGLAAASILKQENVRKWLYFLTPGCAVEI